MKRSMPSSVGKFRFWSALALKLSVISVLIFVGPTGVWGEPPEIPNLNTWVADGRVYAISSGDGVTYIGGNFTYVGPNTGGGAPISEATGSVVPPYLPVNGSIYTAVPDGSGGWYIGGSFTHVGRVERRCIAHILPGGTLDYSWNPQAYGGRVVALAVSGETVYAGGYFTSIGGQDRDYIAALDAATGEATPWNPGANYPVFALAVSEGTVYAGGGFTSIGGQPRSRIAALNALTGKATSWNPNANDGVLALAVSGGTVYAGGWFTSIGDQARSNLAAVDTLTGEVTSWAPNSNGTVDALAVSGETVYVGGAFTSIGDQTRNYIAAVDAVTGEVTSWAPNSNGGVHTLAVSGGTVYAGGGFRSIGGQPRNYIAALDAATGEATSWNPNAGGDAYPHPEVYALAVSEGTVYAGGSLNSIGGQPRNNIAALDAGTGKVTPWNPNAITDGMPPSVPVVTVLAVNEGTVYVGGYFSNIGGQPRNRIAALNAVTGEATPWNPNADAEVWALAFSEGKVYVAGYFWNIGGQPRHRIAALDVVTGEATSWNPDVNGSVYALAAGKGTVYAGGEFTSIGDQTRNYIAAVDAITGEVTSWVPNSNGGLHTLAVSGGTIYVGGDFTRIGGQPRNNIAALDAVTGEATSWNPNADSSIGALAVNGGAVYAAGSDTFGGVRVGSIAQFGVYPLTITPGKLGFDRFCVGATSPCKTLTLTNLLETDLLIDSILLTGPDSEDFIVQSDLCSGIVLTPSGSCTVELSFSPSSKTARFAYVTISSNTPKAWTVDVPLNGTGTFPLALLSPNEWEVIPSGSTYNITWCAPSEAVEFKLQYSTNNGETWKTIASNLSGMTHQWEVPVLQSTRVACHVKVVAYDDTGIKVGADKSDDLFRIEVASITAPFIFEIVPKGTVAYPVTWTMSAAISENVSSATVSYTLGKSGIWKKAVGTVVDPLTGFSWDVPSPAERKNAKLKVVFRDISGDKVATAISSIFRIE